MSDAVYTIPTYIINYVKEQGYPWPYSDMQSYIEEWGNLYRAKGSFWDYRETDNEGHTFEMHRRTIKPAKRVCREWASLLLDEYTQVGTESQECNEWLESFFERTGFYPNTQELIERSWALGTGALALWVDPAAEEMKVRRYYANMVVPLSWDEDGVTEIAFVSQVSISGKRYDQVQMYVIEEDGYHIKTAYFDSNGQRFHDETTEEDYPTESTDPWFAIIKPAIANTCVDLSPYGMSIFEDAKDIMRSVDTAYDAFINEIDVGKLRIFIDDMMIRNGTDEKGDRVAIPFGKSDATVFRNMTGDGTTPVVDYSPTLRVAAQIDAYRASLQSMGDACGFGLKYFDIDNSGGIKTATEVSSDNSALMRNIRKHENQLRKSLQQITRAVLQCARSQLGVQLPEEGDITVVFDDSIITDTAAEKTQDLAEVGVTLNAWEYRMKWYNEDEETAKKNVPGADTTADDWFLEESQESEPEDDAESDDQKPVDDADTGK